MKHLSHDRETAQRYLSDAKPAWRSLWLGQHLMVRNLEQLALALEQTGSQAYSQFVSEKDQDLARWVREVVGDGELADELERVRVREEASLLVRQRVDELRRTVGKSF